MSTKPDHKPEQTGFVRRSFGEQVMDLFTMHAGERRGAALLVLLLCALSGWVVYEQWLRKPEVADLGPLQAEMERWMAAQEKGNAPTVASELFTFDPNTLDHSGWLRLGLSERQTTGIENYRKKGGRFRTKGDLARMYTIKPEQYERLKPYILLPDTLERRVYAERQKYERDTARHNWPERGSFSEERPAFRKVEVNTADTNMLVALPGIGPSFARGIVKYRESLGGYHSLDQLAEVYVLQDKPDAVVKLKELLLLDTLMVRRIAVNSCTAEELAAHPYARWKVAKPLIAYRTQHGPFKQVADIKGCALVTEEVFRKLAPYLSVE